MYLSLLPEMMSSSSSGRIWQVLQRMQSLQEPLGISDLRLLAWDSVLKRSKTHFGGILTFVPVFLTPVETMTTGF